MNTYFSKKFLCGMVFLFFCVLVYAQTPYVVTASKLNVRNTTSPESSVIIGKVVKGDTVLVEKIEGNWAKIPFGLRYGYVSISFIEPAVEEEPQVTVATPVNVPIVQEKQSQPQYVPIMDLGNGYYKMNDKRLNSGEMTTYLQQNCPAAYAEIQHCYTVSRRCNAAWFTLGLASIPFIIGGAVSLKKSPAAGGACIGIGCSCAVALVPLIAVSVVISKNAVSNGVEAYNIQCSRRYTQAPSLEFQLQTSQDGLGLAMKF